MTQSLDDRNLVRIEVAYRLVNAGGWQTPDTQSQIWFFVVPRNRDTDELWGELLHRIFFEANVRMRQREPADDNFLGVDSFQRSPVDIAAMLASDGKSWDASPWYAAQRDVVWEPSACYVVGDDGRYDVMTAGDYTELILWRELNAGRIDQTKFEGFFDHLLALNQKPPMGRKIFEGGAVRLANLLEVRPATGYQKPPMEKPWASGPVDLRLVAKG